MELFKVVQDSNKPSTEHLVGAFEDLDRKWVSLLDCNEQKAFGLVACGQRAGAQIVGSLHVVPEIGDGALKPIERGILRGLEID